MERIGATMIKQYDSALVAKISKWIGEGVRIVQDRQALFVTVLNENNDDMRFPLVAIMRTQPPMVLQTASTWMSAGGYAIRRDKENSSVIRAVPCRLTYGIAILDVRREAIDDLWQQITFLLINNPMLEVEIPYSDVNGKKRTTYATIKIAQDMEDESGVNEHIINGSIYAYEITVTIDDAYLFDTKTEKNVIIDGIEVELKSISDAEDKVRETVIEGRSEG